MLGCSREALLGPASGSSMVALGAGGVEDPLSGSILKAEFSDLCEGLAGGFLSGRNECSQCQLGCGPAPREGPLEKVNTQLHLSTPVSLSWFQAMANTKHFILKVNFFIKKEGRERGMEGGREGEREKKRQRKEGGRKERKKRG